MITEMVWNGRDPERPHTKIFEFPSVGMMMKALDEAPRPPWWAQSFPHWERLNTTYFDHRDWNWVRTAIHTPEPSVLAAIASMRERMTGQIAHDAVAPVRKRNWRRGLADGVQLDPDRYLIRSPQCWDSVVVTPRPRKVLSVLVNTAISCAYTRGDLLPRGAAALALVDWAAENGYSIGVDICTAGTNVWSSEAKHCEVIATAKRPDQPLDMVSLATACCEIAFFRAVVLGIYIVGDATARPLDGLGRPCDVSAPTQKSYDVYVPCTFDHHEDAVQEWLQQTIARLKGGTPQ